MFLFLCGAGEAGASCTAVYPTDSVWVPSVGVVTSMLRAVFRSPVLPWQFLKSTIICVQRFGQGNALRKTIFELIAAELLKSVPMPTPDPSVHQPSQHGSGHGPSFIRCSFCALVNSAFFRDARMQSSGDISPLAGSA